MTKWWTYAVDGSGVALRTPVTVIQTEGVAARVLVEAPTAEVAAVINWGAWPVAPTFYADGSVTVTVAAETLSTEQYPAVASFGWLD